MIKKKQIIRIILSLFCLVFVILDAKTQNFLHLDTIANDSVIVDTPVHYEAKDSMVMTLQGHNMIHLYGEGCVQYKNINLTGEYIAVNADSSTVYATYVLDSVGKEFGCPIFNDGEIQYEMKKFHYNFKTKKMYIIDVFTKQGESFMMASRAKMVANNDLYVENARYTTCDSYENPHFYLNLTRAKIRLKKGIISGPIYLVVEDVPLPIVIPFGFFPFMSDYSSGVIMPTFGDELKFGFSLQNGGYYFAFNQYVDMALTGSIYTRGSWSLNATLNYRKKYKYFGNFQFNYQTTVIGEKWKTIDVRGKKMTMYTTDYNKMHDFCLQWTHIQDAKANPFSTFSSNVNFATNLYNQRDLLSQYSPKVSENVAFSSISYSYRFPESPFLFNANIFVTQIKRDTTLWVRFPNMTISMRDVYPFKRKERTGMIRWYENIKLSYNGSFINEIQDIKEYDFCKKSLFHKWKNKMTHSIPISVSFNLLNAITVLPSVNYSVYWYTRKINWQYDEKHQVVAIDTIFGFYPLQNLSCNINFQTKLYGMFKPWTIFEEWTKKTLIRHIFTPMISFSGALSGNPVFDSYYCLEYLDANEKLKTKAYMPFSHNETMSRCSKLASMNISIDNNLEMKIPLANIDSTRKIVLIDQLRFSTGYNFLADAFNWQDLHMIFRLKPWKNYTVSVNGIFDIYKYNTKGQRINELRWATGSIGRFRGMQKTFSYSLDNKSLKKKISKNKEDNYLLENSKNQSNTGLLTTEIEKTETSCSSLWKLKKQDINYDADGYYIMNVQWDLNFNYSIGFEYDMDHFNKNGDMEYPYKMTQNLGISGNIKPTKGWYCSFSTGYDFDGKRFTSTQLSITRDMHCWIMSASIIPIGPIQSYNFTIAVKSSLLRDLKYSQKSNSLDAVGWGN